MSRTKFTRAATLILLLSGASACRDGTGPDARELTLELRRGDLPFEEMTIAPSSTVQLDATFFNAAGTAQSGGGATWSSTNPSVATVDDSGTVTALQVGTTRIIVEAGARADTGIINVATPVTGALECAPGEATLELNVGEVQTFAGEEAVNLCLSGGGSGADYLLVPFNASIAAGARLDTRVVASIPSTPSTMLSRTQIRDWTLPLRPGARPDEQFHLRHLERSRTEFEPALRLTTSVPEVSDRAAPSIGTLMELNAGTLAGSGCVDPDYRTGRVVAISDHAVVVADTMNPRNGFATADYVTIADTFDDLIWGVNTANFGEPSDIDENDRVIIFYTRAVNELTPAGSDSYVGGFFYNRDLFPTSGANGCAGSNETEMFYMLVPDPDGEVNGNVRGRDFVLERTYSVLAHEFQHLINDSRRLYINKGLIWEEDWLNEGLSHVAEELIFYAASDHSPEQNLGTSAIAGEGAKAFNRYNLDNVERYIRFLREPELHSPMGDVQELATRGAVWAFLRYAADREPGDDGAMWMRLANSTVVGLDNLEEVLGVNPRDWMNDWAISVFTDDAGFPVAEQYTQPSWNFRILTQFLDSSGRFPLRTLRVGPTSAGNLLEGGGAVFLRMGMDDGTKRAVRTTVDDLPPPSRLRLNVVRTR